MIRQEDSEVLVKFLDHYDLVRMTVDPDSPDYPIKYNGVGKAIEIDYKKIPKGKAVFYGDEGELKLAFVTHRGEKMNRLLSDFTKRL